MAKSTDPSSRDLPPDDLGSARHPVLITGAQRTLREEQHERVVKYTLLMAFRIPCLLLAGWAYAEWQNPWVSLAIIVISVPLPWMAVLIANDRPPQRRRGKRGAYEPVSNAPALPRTPHHTIDG